MLTPDQRNIHEYYEDLLKTMNCNKHSRYMGVANFSILKSVNVNVRVNVVHRKILIVFVDNIGLINY